MKKPNITENKSNKESNKKAKNKPFVMSKKKEAISSAAMVLAAGALGYFLFIQDPLATRNAYASELNSGVTSSDEAVAEDGSIKTSKENYDEAEVIEAVANYVSSDPNVRISSQSFEDGEDNLGVLLLSVDHHGLSSELSQYIETINSAPKSIVVDHINYMETLDGVISTDVSVSIPYHKGDQTLADHSFVTEDSSVLADATNSNSSNASLNPSTSKWKKPTPATKSSTSSGSGSTKSNKSSNSAGKKVSTPSSTRRPNNGGSTSKPKPTVPTTQPKPNSPDVTITDKDNPEVGKGQAVEDTPPNTQDQESSTSFVTPVFTPDPDHFAPPYVNYSIIDNVQDIKILDDTKDLAVSREDNKKSDAKQDIIQLNIQSQLENVEIPADLNRVISLSLKQFYLPKNAQTLSITVSSEVPISGKFDLVLQDASGKDTTVQDPKVENIDAKQNKIIFKLNGMDGNIKVKGLNYRVVNKESFNENIGLKNIEISSLEQ